MEDKSFCEEGVCVLNWFVSEVCGRSSCKLDECAAEILSRTRRFMRGFAN